MLGLMTEELNLKTLKNYVKSGEQKGLWSSEEWSTSDSQGRTSDKIVIEYNIKEK